MYINYEDIHCQQTMERRRIPSEQRFFPAKNMAGQVLSLCTVGNCGKKHIQNHAGLIYGEG